MKIRMALPPEAQQSRTSNINSTSQIHTNVLRQSNLSSSPQSIQLIRQQQKLNTQRINQQKQIEQQRIQEQINLTNEAKALANKVLSNTSKKTKLTKEEYLNNYNYQIKQIEKGIIAQKKGNNSKANNIYRNAFINLLQNKNHLYNKAHKTGEMYARRTANINLYPDKNKPVTQSKPTVYSITTPQGKTYQSTNVTWLKSKLAPANIRDRLNNIKFDLKKQNVNYQYYIQDKKGNRLPVSKEFAEKYTNATTQKYDFTKPPEAQPEFFKTDKITGLNYSKLLTDNLPRLIKTRDYQLQQQVIKQNQNMFDEINKMPPSVQRFLGLDKSKQKEFTKIISKTGNITEKAILPSQAIQESYIGDIQNLIKKQIQKIPEPQKEGILKGIIQGSKGLGEILLVDYPLYAPNYATAKFVTETITSLGINFNNMGVETKKIIKEGTLTQKTALVTQIIGLLLTGKFKKGSKKLNTKITKLSKNILKNKKIKINNPLKKYALIKTRPYNKFELFFKNNIKKIKQIKNNLKFATKYKTKEFILSNKRIQQFLKDRKKIQQLKNEQQKIKQTKISNRQKTLIKRKDLFELRKQNFILNNKHIQKFLKNRKKINKLKTQQQQITQTKINNRQKTLQNRKLLEEYKKMLFDFKKQEFILTNKRIQRFLKDRKKIALLKKQAKSITNTKKINRLETLQKRKNLLEVQKQKFLELPSVKRFLKNREKIALLKKQAKKITNTKKINRLKTLQKRKNLVKQQKRKIKNYLSNKFEDLTGYKIIKKGNKYININDLIKSKNKIPREDWLKINKRILDNIQKENKIKYQRALEQLTKEKPTLKTSIKSKELKAKDIIKINLKQPKKAVKKIKPNKPTYIEKDLGNGQIALLKLEKPKLKVKQALKLKQKYKVKQKQVTQLKKQLTKDKQRLIPALKFKQKSKQKQKTKSIVLQKQKQAQAQKQVQAQAQAQAQALAQIQMLKQAQTQLQTQGVSTQQQIQILEELQEFGVPKIITTKNRKRIVLKGFNQDKKIVQSHRPILFTQKGKKLKGKHFKTHKDATNEAMYYTDQSKYNRFKIIKDTTTPENISKSKPYNQKHKFRQKGSTYIEKKYYRFDKKGEKKGGNFNMFPYVFGK